MMMLRVDKCVNMKTQGPDRMILLLWFVTVRVISTPLAPSVTLIRVPVNSFMGMDAI